MWQELRTYAFQCSWKAGKALAQAMDEERFSDWESIFASVDENRICGFCTVTKTDCIPDLPYTPYIGFVFVEEQRRGKRLSQRMLEAAMDYLRSLGFSQVYLISDHEGLYEKYGFAVIDVRKAPWGSVEKIYRHEL